MTLTDYGINYCLKSFGNADECAVSTGYGLTFSYVDTKGIEYTGIAGGTASILNFIALGIVKTLTMDDFPGRGTFTKALVEEENGESISFGDGDIFTEHDENSEDQWCFIVCSEHADKSTCEDVYRCFWWNNGCHDVAPTCEELDNPEDCQRYFPGYYWYEDAAGVFCHPTLVCENIVNSDHCTANGCLWYNGSCHSTLVCEDINNQPDCIAPEHDCFWYRGPTYPTYTCSGEDQPSLCHWADATTGGPYGISSLDIYVLVNAYTPPGTPVPGYNFIPTSLEIFGILLYYQGDMAAGNVHTGCAYP